MKNYKTIEKEIHAKAQEIKSLNKAIEIKGDEISLITGTTLTEIKEYMKDDERRAKKEAIENEACEIGYCLKVAEIELEMMKNNYVISFVHSEMPKAAAIINKYAGKRLGEMTAMKIREEIQEKTNINYVAIDKDNIYCSIKGGNGSYHFGSRYNDFKFLSDDNRIKEFGIENCSIWYISNEYISNTRKAAEKVIKLKEKAEKQLEELRKTLSDYDKLRRGKMRSYYADMR